MMDFAALIERAIERELRSRLVAFLGTYKHVEFGVPRPLALDEAAMVLKCMDAFLVQDSLIDLGVAEIAGLRGRLSALARTIATEQRSREVANACFDALACIAALEARLCRALDRAEVRRVGGQLHLSASNDC
jgi:hypothetical protein